jgi:hypothetical protein
MRKKYPSARRITDSATKRESTSRMDLILKGRKAAVYTKKVEAPAFQGKVTRPRRKVAAIIHKRVRWPKTMRPFVEPALWTDVFASSLARTYPEKIAMKTLKTTRVPSHRCELGSMMGSMKRKPV